ncbi:MAG: hypothetical protein CMJ64_12740 [Planctomycetaceae bacterium]|nr:hypothetical protein [Planctomycetaceae bacterium]
MKKLSIRLFVVALLLAGRPLAADYTATIRSDEPVLYWRFEAVSGDIVRDEAGGANGRARANGPWRRGISGLAASFGRAHLAGRIESELNPEQDAAVEDILNGSFTLELWLLDEAPVSDNVVNSSLFYKADEPQFSRNSMWFYRARQDGNYHFRIHDTSENAFGVSIRNPAGGKAAGDGKWHHAAIVVDRSRPTGTMQAFLDGLEVNQSTFPSSTKIDNNGPLRIGNGVHPNSPWQGLIDEFALYDRALSAEVVGQHRKAGLNSMKTRPKSATALAAKEELFELQVRPLLVQRCGDCHSGEADAESVLSVASRRTLVDGGEYGPTIIPGRAEDSLLIQAVKRTHKELHMPPEKSDSLSNEEVAALRRWIDDGAIWPGSSTEVATSTSSSVAKSSLELTIDPVEDWALQPRRIVPPPPIDEPRWASSPIDRFLEAKRRESGIQATERADRRTLIRRATFDLIGLPPTPDEIQNFVDDPDNDQLAFARVVDRLLGSQHYGERAGRLWLDVARYADTQGDVGDIPIQTAYLYRNWVIDSLNADLPFDEFLRAQIAGDILARNAERDATARGLTVATGFIALSRRFGNTKRDDIHLTIEDTIDTIGRGVLGLTLRCARCHDHKFDPILNTDYYGLYGIFDSTTYPWMGMSNEKSPSDLSPANPNLESSQQADEYWALITRYEYQINNHHRPWLKPTLDEFKAVSEQIDMVQKTETDPVETQLKELKRRREELLGFRGGQFRELMLHGLTWIKKEKQRRAEDPPVEFVFAVSEGKPHDAKLHRRGNPRQPGGVVARRFLQVFDGQTPPTIGSGSGRLELARWLTRPDHPLTARVLVNRIWQQHFGRGLVATPDNFGRQGSKPSHPALLDWLAETFVRDGWSLKELHRRIMLSESYQLSSSAPASVTSDDPENIFVARYPRRRLDTEAIRDAMLAVSGELDRSQGGAHPMPPWYQNRFSLNNPFHLEPSTNRRSVYLLTQRLFRHSILDHFDGPDRNSSTSNRRTSNVPAQALFLMNSSFVREQSEALAAWLEVIDDDATRIASVFLSAFGREPQADELASLQDFLQQYRDAQTDAVASLPSAELVALSRAILTSNEFFFID